jgi:FkbM family methyltransferase
MSQTAQVRVSAPFDLVAYQVVGPSEDQGVIGEIRRSGGTYVPGVMQALRSLLEPDAVAFDVGANIGVFALVMGRLAARGQVFAFEPAPENYDYLLENLRRNGARNVVAERSAVYDQDGTVPFVFSPAGPSASFVSPGAGSAGNAELPGSQPVRAIRLDTYVRDHGLQRVDLIMVDTEGAEMAVLRGAATTLAVHRPALLVEVNPVALRRFGDTSFGALVQHLRSGRRLYSITDAGLPARIVSDRHVELLLRSKGVIDLLALPRPRHLRGAAAGAAWARGLTEAARLEQCFSRARPPDNNFVVEPSFSLGVAPIELSGFANEDVELAVTVRNTSRYWFSSDFVYHPIHVSYRWLDTGGAEVVVDAHRGRFEAPLGPGRATTVRTPVSLPPWPGTYRLAITLLQENFVWFDDLDPALRLTIPGTVTG